MNRHIKIYSQGFYKVWTLTLLTVVLFGSCTGLRKLEDGQVLFTGSDIHIDQEKDIKDKRNLEREVSRVVRPQPNRSLFFLRPRLWMYLSAGEPTGRGVRHWMKNRLGEAPVLMDDIDAGRNVRLIQNRLYNMGYFDASVMYEKDFSENTASVDYHISISSPYVFGSWAPPAGDGTLETAIRNHMDETLIIEDEPYSLDVLRSERHRIDRALKQEGFFYFHPDHILFRADTNETNRRVNIQMGIKTETPAVARRAYRIGHVYIHADYMTSGAMLAEHTDTLRVKDGVYFTDALEQFNPEVIARTVSLKKDSYYDVRDHDRTLNHLMGLETFQFVSLRFQHRDQEDASYLDVNILLTPVRRRSITIELKGVTKSNHFAGPGLHAVLTNHNVWKGAESLKLSFGGAYETLIGRQRSASSTELGMDATLAFPRFMLPFNLMSERPVLSPRTAMSLGWQLLNRTDAFSLNTLQTQIDYSWNSDVANRFRISPLVLNIYLLGDVDEALDGILVGGTLLRKGLFEQFVLGGQYSWMYNSALKTSEKNAWYIHTSLDLSGNLAYLFLHHGPGKADEEDGTYRIFGQAFAQYVKADADVRYYADLGEGHRLVSRIYAGAGFPLGNSEQLPYVKQFVIGGSNSIRAFHPRTLGPGSYHVDDEERGTFQVYQTGDLKLEANLEYRFDITSVFKGAVFVDAGNIWRHQQDENVPGGEFNTDTFVSQIALGAGLGLRIDAGFFLLRFDFAVPLANPATTGRGYFDPVRLADRQWRRDHLVFNLGIGYPF